MTPATQICTVLPCLCRTLLRCEYQSHLCPLKMLMTINSTKTNKLILLVRFKTMANKTFSTKGPPVHSHRTFKHSKMPIKKFSKDGLISMSACQICTNQGIIKQSHAPLPPINTSFSIKTSVESL